MNALELTGRARSHVVELSDPQCVLHRDVRVAFGALRTAAAGAGIDLAPVSGFRDFARQLAIWNGKFAGTTPLLDAAGQPLAAHRLSAAQRIDAILLWSALPGASRHHWGTDLDLIDRAALPPGYRVQLTSAEYAPGGPFARLADWLERQALRFGFFRPFRGRRSAVQPEPWHYSFAPLAEMARQALNPAVLRSALSDTQIAGKELVLERLEELHARYVARIDRPG